MTTALDTLNPFRYRGYVYDEETGLYYLRSRYYNPEWGRFINADTVLGQVGALLSHNLFAYCGNNPVNMSDLSGEFPLAVVLAVPALYDALLLAVAGVAGLIGAWDIGTSIGKSLSENANETSDKTKKNSFPNTISDTNQTSSGNNAPKPPQISPFIPPMIAAQEIAQRFGGKITELEKGIKITIASKPYDIIVRIMEAGSGGRTEPYFRIAIEGLSVLNKLGQLSNDMGATHFTLSTNYVNEIIGIIYKYIFSK